MNLNGSLRTRLVNSLVTALGLLSLGADTYREDDDVMSPILRNFLILLLKTPLVTSDLTDDFGCFLVKCPKLYLPLQ